MNARELLLGSFQAALAAANPLEIVPAHLPDPPSGNTLVVGAGKAAAVMAQAVETCWPADAKLEGMVLTPYGHGAPTEKIVVIEAGHPLPDRQGVLAAQAMLESIQLLKPDDMLLGLFSGGGSSLLCAPVAGVTLEELTAITQQLLRSGASIQEINTVRKHLSSALGGRLAATCCAPVYSLIISDVTDNDPAQIASGPCAPDPTTCQDALAVIERYAIHFSAQVAQILQTGAGETPKPGDPVFRNVRNRIIASAHQSLTTAAQYYRSRRITPLILGDSVTGEAREIAKAYAALAQEIRYYGHPCKPPVALISGGETTVTVKGNGQGGRNSEFLLSLAIALNGLENVYALACDTDGIDGTVASAGAILTPDSLLRAQQLGLNPASLLTNNDSYTFFGQLDDLVTTGPTRTNINDFRVILVL